MNVHSPALAAIADDAPALFAEGRFFLELHKVLFPDADASLQWPVLLQGMQTLYVKPYPAQYDEAGCLTLVALLYMFEPEDMLDFVTANAPRQDFITDHKAYFAGNPNRAFTPVRPAADNCPGSFHGVRSF